MAKAQTDIRTTSYDAINANVAGYTGTIEDALAQIRQEPDIKYGSNYTRPELLHYLGVDKVPSAGPSVEMDQDARYGEEPSTELGVNDPGFYSTAHAKARGWI